MSNVTRVLSTSMTRVFNTTMLRTIMLSRRMFIKRMFMKNKRKKVDSQEVHTTPPCLLTTPTTLHFPYGKDRWEIKVISHGKKLKHFGMYNEAIEPFITMLGLSSLVNLSYEYADHGLIVALTERWHLETNSFYLLVGEMSVTLD
ncbi:hypothetical protein VIGAN_06113500, partial [Vigna angularis var. angularis]